MNENLTLDEVIKKLQEAKRLYGDIPIVIGIDDGSIYNIKSILFDNDSVMIYNY